MKTTNILLLRLLEYLEKHDHKYISVYFLYTHKLHKIIKQSKFEDTIRGAQSDCLIQYNLAVQDEEQVSFNHLVFEKTEIKITEEGRKKIRTLKQNNRKGVFKWAASIIGLG